MMLLLPIAHAEQIPARLLIRIHEIRFAIPERRTQRLHSPESFKDSREALGPPASSIEDTKCRLNQGKSGWWPSQTHNLLK
jgi:hypothetical protein